MENTACFLLALVVTLVPVSTTLGDSDEAETISAVLGHSVTFRCPSNRSIPVHRLYIQKSGQFVNGFDNVHWIDVPLEYLHRTDVNKAELSMEIRNIKISDEGLYECVVFYSATVINSPRISKIKLKVTAKFTTPELKYACSENDGAKKERSCQMSCSAAGGYPVSDVKWLGLNQSRIRVLQNETAVNSTFKTWSVNQTINYTCEHPINVSCDIGGSDSRTITICEAESFPLKVILAIAVLVFVTLLITVFIMLFCRRQTQQQYGSDPQVDGAHIPLDDCHSQRQSV